MKEISKKEKKLLNAAKKLEKATKKYMKKLMKIDETFQKIPTSMTRAYNLEDRYFRQVPAIAIAATKLELLSAYLESEIGEEIIGEASSWEDLNKS
jgi:DNA repair protein RadC